MSSPIEMQALAYAMQQAGAPLPPFLMEHAVISQANTWTKLVDGDAAEPEDAFAGRLNPPLQAKLTKAQKRQVDELLAALSLLGLDKPQHALIPALLTDKRFAAWSAEVRSLASSAIEVQLADSGQEAIDAVRRAQVSISFNLQNRRAQEFIEDAAKRMANDTTQTLTATLRDELTAGIDAGESTSKIATRIEQSPAVTATRARAERIARTETAFAAIKGTEEGWRQSGVVYGWKYLLAPDACPVCVAAADKLNKRVVKLGDAAFDVGTVLEVEGQKSPTVLNYEPDPGKGLVIPPVHPHCRCTRIAVLFDEFETD